MLLHPALAEALNTINFHSGTNPVHSLIVCGTNASHAESVTDMLHMVNEGNKAAGGLQKRASACGLVGFVKFLDCYYITLVTKKSKVGCIRGHSIYTIKETEMVPIKPADNFNKGNVLSRLWNKMNKKITQTRTESDELRHLTLFQFVDMTKDFYFAYSYDLTSTLQHNYICQESVNLNERNQPPTQVRICIRVYLEI